MPVFLIVIVAVSLFIIYVMVKVGPAIDRLFSLIWSEDQMDYETRKRISELFIDSEEIEETKLMTAAMETKRSARDILSSFGAKDAKDLGKILRGQYRGLLANARSSVSLSRRASMTRRRK